MHVVYQTTLSSDRRINAVICWIALVQKLFLVMVRGKGFLRKDNSINYW